MLLVLNSLPVLLHIVLGVSSVVNHPITVHKLSDVLKSVAAAVCYSCLGLSIGMKQ